MTVPIAFALFGGVILIGFFANLLFRATRIPSVLLLIGIGVLLGPATGWIKSNFLVSIAPFFGALALLVILFEGGLELDIESALKHAPMAALLSILVFIFSFVSVAAFAHYIFRMSLLHSLVMAGILGASSPAICIPIVSGLSVRNEIKTILKLESALGDVLLIVTVLLLLDFQTTGGQGWTGMLSSFFMSFAVAFVISSVAGALWSRLIGWMGKEPLAYMLTLGFLLLLYFAVEELHGSAPLAVLMFGLMLANMHVVADRLGERVRFFFGIDIRAEQFVLHQFMKNITEELSFLIRTFFFVYLGLLLDFRMFTLWIGISGAGAVILLLGGRWLAVYIVRKRSRWSSGEAQLIMTMLPRGLATAVMAFLPMQHGMAGADLFPIYAFIAIVLTNVLMTGGVIAAERRLALESSPSKEPEVYTPVDELLNPESNKKIPIEISGPTKWETAERQPMHLSFSDRMARLVGIRPEARRNCYIEAIRSASLVQQAFWVQILLSSIITALGLILNQSSIIIGAALIMPIALPVLAAGLALAIGDIYLLLKLLLKLSLVVLMVAGLCAVFSKLLPFSAVTSEIASRTKPTILDFLVALFAGMSGAAILFSRKRMLHYVPGAILALTLLPPLAVIGFGLGSEFSPEIFRGAALFFVANFFAAILGALLIYSAVGMSGTAALPAIRAWKRRELSRPAVELIFGTLRLRGVIDRAGSVRSRLTVMAVFLLALVIPLQMAFNQLSLEFRARQAISEVEKMFDVSGRSAIINSTPYIGENAITVRIQVATNAFFTSSDIERFEERVSDRAGKPTILNLVQSLSDMGEGAKIRNILSPSLPAQPEYRSGVAEIAASLHREVEKCLQTAAFPPSITILQTSAEFSSSPKEPAFRIEYLSETPLSADAKMILMSHLERQMNLKKGDIYLIHFPARYEFDLNSRGQIREEDETKLLAIQNRMVQCPQLRAKVELPAKVGEKQAEKIQTALNRLAPMLTDSSRTIMASNDGSSRRFIIALQPALSPNSKIP